MRAGSRLVLLGCSRCSPRRSFSRGALRGCRFVVRTRDRQPCRAPRSPSPCSDRSSRPRERGAPSRGLPRAPVDSCPSCRERMRGGLRRSAPGDAPRASGARPGSGPGAAAAAHPGRVSAPGRDGTTRWPGLLPPGSGSRDLQAGGATTENRDLARGSEALCGLVLSGGCRSRRDQAGSRRLLKYSRWQTG